MVDKEIDFRHETRERIKLFPDEVRMVLGRALHKAQLGGKDANSKPLKGFAGASVQEITARAPDGTYRVIYTTLVERTIIVLHAFQKKSLRGISTPKREMDIIKQRLKEAKKDYHQ